MLCHADLQRLGSTWNSFGLLKWCFGLFVKGVAGIALGSMAIPMVGAVRVGLSLWVVTIMYGRNKNRFILVPCRLQVAYDLL